jgi:hypothetical protein
MPPIVANMRPSTKRMKTGPACSTLTISMTLLGPSLGCLRIATQSPSRIGDIFAPSVLSSCPRAPGRASSAARTRESDYELRRQIILYGSVQTTKANSSIDILGGWPNELASFGVSPGSPRGPGMLVTLALPPASLRGLPSLSIPLRHLSLFVTRE